MLVIIVQPKLYGRKLTQYNSSAKVVWP